MLVALNEVTKWFMKLNWIKLLVVLMDKVPCLQLDMGGGVVWPKRFIPAQQKNSCDTGKREGIYLQLSYVFTLLFLSEWISMASK